MIYKQDESYSLRRKAFINLGQDVDDKTILLCVGGYLHVLDGLYRNIGNGQLLVNTGSIDIIQRYIESRSLIDLSDLTVLIGHNELHGIPVDALQSEEAIVTYLSHHLSFVVVIDSPGIITKRTDLEPFGIPGVTVSEARPQDLMFHSNGMGAVYRTYEDWGKWVLNYPTKTTNGFRYTTSECLDVPAIDDGYDFSNRPYLSYCHLLEIGKETLIDG